jgi:hypothetical protein
MRFVLKLSLELAVLATVFPLSSVMVAIAQVTTATFYGVVRDPTGAVIPGAEVTLTHKATSAVRQTTTGDTGEFVFTTLPVEPTRLES